MSPKLSLSAAILLCAVANNALGQVSVAPANPRALETVRVQIASLPISASFINFLERRISMSANKITVEIGGPGLISIPLPPPTQPAEIAIGQFPAGNYEVEVRRGLGASGELVGLRSFVVSDRSNSDPLQNNTDIWWNPSESGWGLNLIQHGSGIIFATWFNYAPDGKPIWYVIPEGQWVDPIQYHGPIFRTTGPVVAESFDPTAVTVTMVGSAVLIFNETDLNKMTAALTVDGNTITRQLQRQGF